MALTPVGLVLGIAAAYGLAGLLGVTLDPSNPEQTRSFLQNTLCYGAATLVALVAPGFATYFAANSYRSHVRTSATALVVSLIVCLGVVGVMIPSFLSW